MKRSLAIDLGGTHVRFRLLGGGARPAPVHVIETSAVTSFEHAVEQWRDMAGMRERFAAIGVAAAGPVTGGRGLDHEHRLGPGCLHDRASLQRPALPARQRRDRDRLGVAFAGWRQRAVAWWGQSGERSSGRHRSVRRGCPWCRQGGCTGRSGCHRSRHWSWRVRARPYGDWEFRRDRGRGRAPHPLGAGSEGGGDHLHSCGAIRARFGRTGVVRAGYRGIWRALVSLDGARRERARTAAEIARDAFDRSDPIAEETITTFTGLLGSVAGDLALTLGARGGVYIAGGIVPEWGERFDAERFLTDSARRAVFVSI